MKLKRTKFATFSRKRTKNEITFNFRDQNCQKVKLIKLIWTIFENRLGPKGLKVTTWQTILTKLLLTKCRD